MGSWIFYFGCIILNLLLLIWWRRGTRWDCYNADEIKFPSRGHILIGFAFSLIPIWSCIQFIILAIWYIVARIEGNIVLKGNKFNHYWFGIELEEDDED